MGPYTHDIWHQFYQCGAEGQGDGHTVSPGEKWDDGTEDIEDVFGKVCGGVGFVCVCLVLGVCVLFLGEKDCFMPSVTFFIYYTHKHSHIYTHTHMNTPTQPRRHRSGSLGRPVAAHCRDPAEQTDNSVLGRAEQR